jgi:hypothetical protein
VDEILPDLPLNRDDEGHQPVGGSEVRRLMNENQPWVSDGSDEEDDDTTMEYWSEDEVNPMDVDSDDE